MSMFTRRDWLKVAAASPVALSGVPARLHAAPVRRRPEGGRRQGRRVPQDRAEGRRELRANPRAGEPGLTALIAAALVRNGVPADNAVVAKALKYLETKVKKDGGVYDQGLANYMTCLAIVAFKEANAGGKYDKVIEAATKYVKSLQYDEGLTEKDPKFGGAGYDKPSAKGRPGPVEHAVHGRGAARRRACRRTTRPSRRRSCSSAAARTSRASSTTSRSRRRPPTTTRAASSTTCPTRTTRRATKRTADGRAAERGRHDLRRAQELPLRRRVGKDDPRVKAAIDVDPASTTP